MTHLLTQYILLAMGLISSLALFVTLKYEIQVCSRKQRRRFEEMVQRLREAEPIADQSLVVPAAARSRVNVNWRVPAMRMLRRGENAAHIAAALGVPRPEVELLIRVQCLVQTA